LSTAELRHGLEEVGISQSSVGLLVDAADMDHMAL